jgi:EmrB/QacA subfamily drug resistance transporter
MSQTQPRCAPPAETPRPYSSSVRDGISDRVVVALACVCAFMVVMDSSIVNVALPSIRGALGLSSSGQQWVIDSYLLTLGGFLLLGARLADIYGRQRVLQIGIVIFTVGSLAGGLAQSGTMLILARGVQGVGGSILAPSGLSLIIATVPEGKGRGKAMSFYAATGSIAATAGVLIGGALTQALSWRWVMFINVPVGIGLLLATARLLRPTADAQNRGQLDVIGAALVTAGVGALVEGFSNAQQHGWGAALTLGAIATSIVLLAGFFWTETRAEQPLVRLSVFALPGVRAGNILIACNGTVLTASTFFLSQILQNGLGNNALQTGVRLIPLAIGIFILSLLSPRATKKFGPRPVLLLGLSTAAAGYVWLGLMGEHPSYLSNLLGPLLIVGIGLGLTVMPSTRAAAAGIPPQEAGLASGLFNVSRQIGAAIGVAGLVTLAVARSHAAHTQSPVTAQLHGNASALLACAGLCMLALLATLLLPPTSSTP